MKFETLWIDSRETAKREEEWLPKMGNAWPTCLPQGNALVQSLIFPRVAFFEHLAARSFLLGRAGSPPEVPDPMKSPDGHQKSGQDVCTDSDSTGKCCRKGTWKRHQSLHLTLAAGEGPAALHCSMR